MEKFNSKLFTKYQNLKKRKAYTEEEQINKAYADFRSFYSATESIIKTLENEKDILREQMTSMEDNYEKELLDERQKSEDLASEVSRLKSMLAERNDRHIFQHDSPISPAVRTRSPTQDSSRRESLKLITVQNEEQQNDAIVPYARCIEEQSVPNCCRRTVAYSGGEQLSCVLHKIVELLAGMKFSVNNQAEGLFLSFLHPKSGYTFNLTLKEDHGEDDELVYQVSSLGALENVALEWMKEDIVFGTTMLPVFFERISKITRLHG